MAKFGSLHKNSAQLDGIRLRQGLEPLKSSFHAVANNDPERAAKLINDQRLLFPSLFALQSEIRKYDLHNRLNTRNAHALDLVNDIQSGCIQSTCRQKLDHLPALKWMMETGSAADGMNEQYDEVMDASALMLTRVHHDNSCLRHICDMIFNRYRKGFYIYDLVWAFFESADPDDLDLIARRLRSSDPKDVELARRLLNFIPAVEKTGGDRLKQYGRAVNWLRRNGKNLRYTGDSFQMNSDPRRYVLAGGEADGGVQ